MAVVAVVVCASLASYHFCDRTGTWVQPITAVGNSVDVYLAIRVVVPVIGSVLYPEDKWVSDSLCCPKAWIASVPLRCCVWPI